MDYSKVIKNLADRIKDVQKTQNELNEKIQLFDERVKDILLMNVKLKESIKSEFIIYSKAGIAFDKKSEQGEAATDLAAPEKE